MGHDSVDFIIIQDLDETLGYQDITKSLDQSHNAGCEEFAFKDSPFQDIVVSHRGLSAHGFDPFPDRTLGQGTTLPERLDQRRPHNNEGCEETGKENELTFWRGQHVLGGLKRQKVDNIHHCRDQEPGQDDRKVERNIG
jgi:hypothetical protein